MSALNWDSVLDIPEGISPFDLHQAVEDLWARGDEDSVGLAFDIAQGLYWHCADWHEGQCSERYSILSTLGYHPSPLESSSNLDGDGHYVYTLLERGAA